MSNKIVYKSTYYGQNFTFTDIDLIHGSMKDTLNNALVSETLSIDTASFTLIGRDRGEYEPLLSTELVDNVEVAEELIDVDSSPLYANTLEYYGVDFGKYRYGDEVDFYDVTGGSKNLLNPAWWRHTNPYTSNGIKWTLNQDGSVTANGTATANSSAGFDLDGHFSGNFYFCTNVNSVSANAAYGYIWNVTQGSRCKQWDGATNCGSSWIGANLQEVQLNNTDAIQFSLRVASGQTVNNLRFEPMILADTETNTTFVPYSPVVTTLQGKYYLTDVIVAGDGSGETTFKMESMMGLLNDIDHQGGVYVNATAGDIIASIMGSYSYTIDGQLSATELSGWLPFDTCLANLTQVLFACGASVMKDANGDLEFTYNLPQTASVFSMDKAYLGGDTRDVAPATLIKVTEHTYYASATVQVEELFNNNGGVTASNYEIRFDGPYHSLVATGLTINSSGANWAVVSGVGTLTGIPYLHIQRIRNKSTGITARPNEKTAAECTLVSALNADQVLDRLCAYYSQTEEINLALVVDDEKPGALIRVPNPAHKTKNISGYIKGMKRTFSSNIKAEVTITSGWVPGHIGNSYDSYTIVTKSDIASNTWTVPNALRGKRALIVLFAGAQGGQGGWYGDGGDRVHGDSGQAAYISDKASTRYDVGNPGSPGSGSDGGNGGQGGFPGKLIMFNIASLANSYSVTLGTGGAGGSGGTAVLNTKAMWPTITYSDPTDGSYGTHSTFGSYDTNDGFFIEADYINMITGAVLVPQHGDTGIKGAKGGNGGTSKAYVKNSTSSSYDYSVSGRGKNGGNLTVNGVTYYGGTGADGTVGYSVEAYSSTSSAKRYHHFPLCGGGGGGGAAAGANGGNGNVQTEFPRINDGGDYDVYSGTWYGRNSSNPSDNSYITSSNGGDGADASLVPAKAELQGGSGGNGGGGAGGAASQNGWMNTIYLNGGFSRGWGLNGKGGNGSSGGQGSDGWFIVYYKG